MAVKNIRPVSAGRRHRISLIRDTSNVEPQKSLTKILNKNSGRNNSGKITVRHQGGRNKRFYRVVDFRRNKSGIKAKVDSIQYDPNRTANIALLNYVDGEKRYIIAPAGLVAGDVVLSGEFADTKVGNSLPLKFIPVGSNIHNIELHPGRGAKLVRSAGQQAVIMSRGDAGVTVKLPSSEIRIFSGDCQATIGQVSNVDHSNTTLGKAGNARHRGRRPVVRGVAQDPRSHPHGGGEGRSGIGMPTPKSVYGKPIFKKTRSKTKASNKFIVARRKKR